MPAKYFILLFFSLLFASFALADISLTLQDSYPTGSNIAIAGVCTPSTDVAFQVKGGDEPWFDQKKSGADGSFSIAYVPPSDGTYTLYVACGADTKNKQFCVGSSCAVGTDDDDDDSGSSPSSSSGSGGGGPWCTSKWSCDPWSFCNATLQQTRVCFDLNGCTEAKIENQSCPACIESWTCTQWSKCNNFNKQVRTCVDQHSCGSVKQVPVEVKECDAPESGPAPATIAGTYQQGGSAPKTTQPSASAPAAGFSFMGFWQDYSLWIMVAGGALLLLVIIILLIIHFVKPKKVVYNHQELVDWIGKEQKMGTSVADIKKILAQNTGWTDEEIEQAFGELQTPNSKSNTTV